MGRFWGSIKRISLTNWLLFTVVALLAATLTELLTMNETLNQILICTRRIQY